MGFAVSFFGSCWSAFNQKQRDEPFELWQCLSRFQRDKRHHKKHLLDNLNKKIRGIEQLSWALFHQYKANLLAFKVTNPPVSYSKDDSMDKENYDHGLP